jgi:hypothetical protein
MKLSSLALLVWVALVSIWVRGWESTHTWLGWAVFVAGVVFIAIYLLEWLGVLTSTINAPHRRARVAAPVETPPAA